LRATEQTIFINHYSQKQINMARFFFVLLFLLSQTAFLRAEAVRDSLIDLDDFFNTLTIHETVKSDSARVFTVEQRILDGYHQKAFDYIEQYKTVAVGEMEKFGIPASITLAQALVESGFGKSKMAQSINNHFGIKCKPEQRKQKGKCYVFHDDTRYDRFVKFENAWASYRAHSLLLKSERYQPLFELQKTDYEAWALGLQAAGYASDANYAKKLVRLIELYELYELDEE
jgi:flagellum-specific peptidoglycan hydrolase FlgJ